MVLFSTHALPKRSHYRKQRILSLSVLSILSVVTLLAACHKNTIGDKNPPVSPESKLIDGPWLLVSITYDTSSTVSIQDGSAGDSLQFGYQFDSSANVVPSNITSFIGGTITQYGYSFYYTNTLVGGTDANLMMICTQPWEIGYSDTLTVVSLSDQLLVFRVNTSNGLGYQIDSLDKIRFY